jgi:hypothetical protein
MVSTFDDQYDWGPLGRAFWSRAALETGATPLQARFAVAKTRGLGHAAAARAAGCGRMAKSQGYEMSRNPKVVAMLAMAATSTKARPKQLDPAPRPEGEMTPTERSAILTAIARDQEPALKIRAVEALDRITDREEQRERREYSMDEAVEASFKSAGLFGPQFIVESFFNRHKSLPWNSDAFVEIAPKLAAAFPERWQHYRNLLPHHRLKFAEVGIDA